MSMCFGFFPNDSPKMDTLRVLNGCLHKMRMSHLKRGLLSEEKNK